MDQMFFAKKAKSLGPIFKTAFHGRYATCLVGHKHARELLNTHENALRGCDIELRNLFPKGSIRAMSGEDHQKYRRIFFQALNATPLAFHEHAIRECARSKLAALATHYSGTPVPGPTFDCAYEK
jgi:cytochrome P450